jgi:HAD superfamily hydrolase (TIGR01509 family)
MRFPEPLRALIFDVDGTLAETEALHLAAFNAAFAAAGHDWEWSDDDYTRLLTTTGGKERIARFLRERGEVAEPEAIAALHRDKTARYVALAAEGIALRSGVAALIAEARARGLALAVATTTTPANVDALTRSAMGVPAAAVFDVIAAGDEVAAKKPAPDVYHLALARLGLPAEACVAFEDSRNGLLAAKAAGLFTVVAPGRFTAHEAFTEADVLVRELPPLTELAAAACA